MSGSRPAGRCVTWAKIELFRGPLAWLFPRLGAFPVRRGEADADALETARQILAAGGFVVMFPEGTRIEQPDALGLPHHGAGQLALETAAPIIPAAITGTSHLWRGALPKLRRVQLTFLPPVRPATLEDGRDAITELIDRLVWPAVQEEYGRLRARPGVILAGLAALGIGGGLVARRQLEAARKPRMLGKVEPRRLRRRNARNDLCRACNDCGVIRKDGETMTHRDFGRDSGLQARMLATMFLLGLVFAVMIAVAIGAGAGTAGVIAIAAVFFAIQLFASGPDRAGGDGCQGGVGRGRPGVARRDRTALRAGENSQAAHRCGHGADAECVCARTLAQDRDGVRDDGAARSPVPGGVGRGARARAHPRHQLRCDGDDDRELLRVDRGAAIITGRPSALSSALMKIAGTIEQIPSRDLRTAAQMNAFFILPARRKGALTGLFATHPPLEKRIAALARLEEQLQGSR